MTEPWDVAVDYAGATIVSNKPAMTGEKMDALERERLAMTYLLGREYQQWRLRRKMEPSRRFLWLQLLWDSQSESDERIPRMLPARIR